MLLDEPHCVLLCRERLPARPVPPSFSTPLPQTVVSTNLCLLFCHCLASPILLSSALLLQCPSPTTPSPRNKVSWFSRCIPFSQDRTSFVQGICREWKIVHRTRINWWH